GALVVEAGDLREVDAGLGHSLVDRAAQAVDLGRGRAGELAADGDVAALPGLRGLWLVRRTLPRRSRALEGDDVLERELVESRAVAGALQEVEEREPGELRELGVVVVDHSLFEQR